jgi:type II secretion system protein G
LKLEKGFTLVELLVVISIIGLLASILFVSLNSAIEKAKIARAVSDIRQIQTAIGIFQYDTGELPGICDYSCTATNDPYLNSLDVPGWNGPYAEIWNRSDPWGGDFGARCDADIDGDGQIDCGILLNDDRQGTNGDDNGAQKPYNVMVRIDTILDDGDLSTGVVRSGVPGEVVYIWNPLKNSY